MTFRTPPPVEPRVVVPPVRLAHGYTHGGLDPVLTLLWALHLWSGDVAHYTAHGLAVTGEATGRVACDPCSHDAREWSVVGALTQASYSFRFWVPTFGWPVIRDDFARDATILLALDTGLESFFPSQAPGYVDEHARRLTFTERAEWISRTVAARRAVVEGVIESNQRARVERAAFGGGTDAK